MTIKNISKIAAGVALAVAATASYGMSTFGSHPKITEEAAKYGMWAPEAMQLLKASVVYPDRDFNTTGGNKDYIPEVHFDRYQTETNKEAFTNGIVMFRKNLTAASKMAIAGDLNGAFTYLGSALHASEDFISHSNYIEMTEKEQRIIDEIFFEGRDIKDMPKTLKLTHYDPDMPIPGIPEGSDYPHNIMSKDYPFRGKVSRRHFENYDALGYEVAFEKGVRYGRRVLNMFMLSVPEDVYRTMTNVELWNVYPPKPSNCKVGSVEKITFGTGMDANVNVVCEGKPDYIYPPLTNRKQPPAGYLD